MVVFIVGAPLFFLKTEEKNHRNAEGNQPGSGIDNL